jgi:hypothetical protein
LGLQLKIPLLQLLNSYTMPLNSVLELYDQTVARDKFDEILGGGDKAIFLILGNTAAHQALAAAAAPEAVNWRWVVIVANYQWLNPTLANLKVTDDPPIPAIGSWFAVCINFSTDIVEIYTDDDGSNIVPCFLLASSKSDNETEDN